MIIKIRLSKYCNNEDEIGSYGFNYEIDEDCITQDELQSILNEIKEFFGIKNLTEEEILPLMHNAFECDFHKFVMDDKKDKELEELKKEIEILQKEIEHLKQKNMKNVHYKFNVDGKSLNDYLNTTNNKKQENKNDEKIDNPYAKKELQEQINELLGAKERLKEKYDSLYKECEDKEKIIHDLLQEKEYLEKIASEKDKEISDYERILNQIGYLIENK